jgi:hypothetical protein
MFLLTVLTVVSALRGCELLDDFDGKPIIVGPPPQCCQVFSQVPDAA